MSCERNRGAFFAALAAEAPLAQALGGEAAAAARCLTTLYETASRRTEVSPLLADALTLALFAEMRQRGLTPPTHSASGLPLPSARQGYAAVMQTLRAIRTGGELPSLAQEVRQAARAVREGRGSPAPAQEVRQAARAVREGGASPTPARPVLASARASAPARLAPDSPPGDVPPALRTLLDTQVGSWPRRKQELLRDFANGSAPGSRWETDTLGTMLKEVAEGIQTAFAGQHSKVPLIFWAREYRNSPAKRHALAMALFATLGQPRCPSCGQWMAASGGFHRCPSRTFGPDGYNGLGVDRYGVTRFGTRPDGTPVPKRRTLLDAGKEFVTPTDPINNASMADLWGRIASAIAGHPCRVMLHDGGFCTDMEGTIYADPYPLGKDADPRHNLLVTKAGIYHEVAHELCTPPEDWALILAIRDGKENVEGIDKGRGMVGRIYNVIEDGRIEREVSSRFAGVAETLAAGAKLDPCWDEEVGPEVPITHEVMGALLYTALPFSRVRDEVRAAMTPAGRALFEELEPLARRGALGSSEDSLAAALEIARRLEAAGIFDVPAMSATPPPLPVGTKVGTLPEGEGRNGPRVQGTAEAPMEPVAAGQGVADDTGPTEPDRGSAWGGPVEVEQDQAVAPALPEERAFELPDEEALEELLNELEEQAVRAVDWEIARQGTYETLGRALHAPLPAGGSLTQLFLSASGRVVSVETWTPVADDPGVVERLAARRPAQQEISGRLARRLESIRQETLTRLRLQTEGALDRRRLPAALAGRQEVRTKVRIEEQTGMAVSLLLDQSGSMGRHIYSGRLYDATSIVGQALEQLEIPYEVRGHGGSSRQYKAMDEATLAPERAALLMRDNTTSNMVTAPVVGLATTALLARPDQNRLVVNLMDGDMDDHDRTVTQYQATRRAGVVTFGVFLGKPIPEQEQRMTELFGRGSWRAIDDLKELPAVVGQRIADIFESLGGEG